MVTRTLLFLAFVKKAVVWVYSDKRQADTLAIVNSAVSGQVKSGKASCGIIAASHFHICLKNTALTSHLHGLIIVGLLPNTYSEAYPLNYNCTFLDNVRDMVTTSPDSTQVELTIKNTIFKFTNRQAVIKQSI